MLCPVARRSPRWGKSSGDELLAAVDVVGRPPGQCGIGHQVQGKGCHVRRPDDPPDRQRGAQLFPAVLEFGAEQACR